VPPRCFSFRRTEVICSISTDCIRRISAVRGPLNNIDPTSGLAPHFAFLPLVNRPLLLTMLVLSPRWLAPDLALMPFGCRTASCLQTVRGPRTWIRLFLFPIKLVAVTCYFLHVSVVFATCVLTLLVSAGVLALMSIWCGSQRGSLAVT